MMINLSQSGTQSKTSEAIPSNHYLYPKYF